MILSASRRTDIPAFYSDWFINRLREGYAYVRNPMYPKKVSKIILSNETIDCIVFWTKNPSTMIPKLEMLKDYTYYFQYTLNPYSREIETNVPSYEAKIKTFITLSQYIGKDRVIWRYDPIFLTNTIDTKFHILKFKEMANTLKEYTSKVVISILDNYRKIKKNMDFIGLVDMSKEELALVLTSFKEIADKSNLVIQSCAEDIDLSSYGIFPGKCIDDHLISQLTGQSISVSKDRNQREVCQCVESIDIGSYNTCLHNCKYCYANFNPQIVRKNYEIHDDNSPFLFGNIQDDDIVTERKIKIYKSLSDQVTFFTNSLNL